MSVQAPGDPMAGETLAAEYALGVLEGDEYATAAARQLADPAFALEVEAWRSRLGALSADLAAVTPPPDGWERLMRRLDAEGARGEPVALQDLRRKLVRWRATAAGAAALAACLALALVWPGAPRLASPPLQTARLSASARGPAVFVALYDPRRRAIVLTPASVSATADRSPELWLIPSGGRPVALGVADFAGSVQLVSPGRADRLADGVLAVSVEPRGGSPTGQPTGPVIATGQLSRL